MLETKSIEIKTLGETLKDARESCKITFGQASRKTGIPAFYLQYLEEENYKRLPADVYVVAYLKKYSKLLNLESKDIIDKFKAERGALRMGRVALNKKNLFVITPKKLSLVLGIIVISLIVGYFWHQLSYLINPPVIKLVQPVADFSTSQTVVEVIGKTESDVYITINGREVYVDDSGNFKSLVNLDAGLNILKIEAKDRFGKINTVTRKIIVTQ